MDFKRRRRIPVHLDIAPLIDIVFLLLIFFMLTASFMKPFGLKVKLPVSTSASTQTTSGVIITILAAGGIFLGEKGCGIDELESLLVMAIEEQKSGKVVLKAENKVDIALVVHIMDIARKAGATDLVIATDKAESLLKK